MHVCIQIREVGSRYYIVVLFVAYGEQKEHLDRPSTARAKGRQATASISYHRIYKQKYSMHIEIDDGDRRKS